MYRQPGQTLRRVHNTNPDRPLPAQRTTDIINSPLFMLSGRGDSPHENSSEYLRDRLGEEGLKNRTKKIIGPNAGRDYIYPMWCLVHKKFVGLILK
jgi:hypothetical protein